MSVKSRIKFLSKAIVRNAAIHALYKTADVFEKVKLRIIDRCPEVRKAAALTLDRLDESGKRKWANTIRGDADDYVRLGKSRLKERTQMLADAAERWYSKEISNVYMGLSFTKDKRAVEFLLDVVSNHKKEGVRIEAAKVLTNIKGLDRETIQSLVDMYDSTDGDLREQIVKSLPHAKDHQSISPIMNMLRADASLENVVQ